MCIVLEVIVRSYEVCIVLEVIVRSYEVCIVLEVIVRSYEVWCGTDSEHRPYKCVFATWCVVAVCKCCTTVFVCSSIPKNRLLENGLEIRRLVLAVLCIGAATWWLVERNKRCGIVCHTLCFSHTVSCYCTYKQ